MDPIRVFVIATGQIGPANRAGKQRVANEEILTRLAFLPDLQADAARTVAGRVMRPRLVAAKRNLLAGRIEPINRRLRFDTQSEHGAELHHALVQEQIVAMEVDGNAQRLLRHANAGDVVHVRMREQDEPNRQRLLIGECQEIGHFVARIDQDRFARVVARRRRNPFLKNGATALSLN